MSSFPVTHSHRLEFADGLRGICAVWIVVFHYILAFAPLGFIGYQSAIHPNEFDPVAYYYQNMPWSLVTNNSPLYVFFALIAFIVSHRFFSTHNSGFLKKQSVKRYFRLMPPVLASIIISYLVYKMGLTYNQEVGLATNAYWGIQSNWDLIYYTGDLSFFGAVWNGIYEVFLPYKFAPYNSPTWCMFVILFGSYLTYAFLALFGDAKNKSVFYVLAMAVCILYQPFSYYAVFILGTLAGEIVAKSEHKKNSTLGLALIILGLLVGCFPKIWLAGKVSIDIFYGIASFLLILGCAKNTLITKFLSLKIFKPLSRLSFSIILTHFIILFSFSGYLFQFFYIEHGFSFGISILLLSLFSVPVIYGVAFVFFWLFEKPTEKLCDIVTDVWCDSAGKHRS